MYIYIYIYIYIHVRLYIGSRPPALREWNVAGRECAANKDKPPCCLNRPAARATTYAIL